MSSFLELLQNLSDDENERLITVARFAELGISASAVIHEIRQPMTALSMTLQLMKESVAEENEELEAGLSEAMRLVERTEQLIERARDFMTPSSQTSQVDLVASITRVLSAFQWQLSGNSSITLATHVPDSLPTVSGDNTQIEQLLANLISNGIDAVGDQEEAVILIEGHARASGDVELIVADNGTGMSCVARENAFEPFFSTKGSARGTGLGLFIVRQIAVRHNGDCRILSESELAQLQIPNLKTGIGVVLPGTDFL